MSHPFIPSQFFLPQGEEVFGLNRLHPRPEKEIRNISPTEGLCSGIQAAMKNHPPGALNPFSLGQPIAKKNLRLFPPTVAPGI
jgi:hypothetical protein